MPPLHQEHEGRRAVTGGSAGRSRLTPSIAFVLAATLTDPFGFLGPTATISEREQRRLAAGEAVVRTVRARPRDVTLLAAVKLSADAPRLIAWYRTIEQLRKSPYVPEIGRFSNPPRLEDLNGLTIDQADADELRRCRPEDCGLKLRPAEIREMKTAFSEPKHLQAGALQTAFRRVVLARAQQYLQSGRADGPPPPQFLLDRWPELSKHIQQYPKAPLSETESLLYWSKEKLSGKPIVSATHVTIAHGRSDALPSPVVVSRQIFATHYVDGAWGATTIARGADGTGYLVYVNQSQIDLLRGIFGGLVRSAIERQLRGEADDLVQGIRRRLEDGDPPRN